MSDSYPILDAINQSRVKLQISQTPILEFRFLEQLGGKITKTFNYEPDPVTFRDEFYYHSRRNILYKRQWIKNDPLNGILLAIWKQVSSDGYQLAVSKTVAQAINGS